MIAKLIAALAGCGVAFGLQIGCRMVMFPPGSMASPDKFMVLGVLNVLVIPLLGGVVTGVLAHARWPALVAGVGYGLGEIRSALMMTTLPPSEQIGIAFISIAVPLALFWLGAFIVTRRSSVPGGPT